MPSNQSFEIRIMYKNLVLFLLFINQIITYGNILIVLTLYT